LKKGRKQQGTAKKRILIGSEKIETGIRVTSL